MSPPHATSAELEAVPLAFLTPQLSGCRTPVLDCEPGGRDWELRVASGGSLKLTDLPQRIAMRINDRKSTKF